jgi:hypothetical protein
MDIPNDRTLVHRPINSDADRDLQRRRAAPPNAAHMKDIHFQVEIRNVVARPVDENGISR